MIVLTPDDFLRIEDYLFETFETDLVYTAPAEAVINHYQTQGSEEKRIV